MKRLTTWQRRSIECLKHGALIYRIFEVGGLKQMITKHYLIYSKTAVKECELLGISDLALFRYSREHTGGRVMKVFKNLILYRPRRCKKNKEDGILNNVYIITGADEIALQISKQTMKFEDMDPERIVRVRMNSKDMTISTSCIFNKENPWEAIV